MNVILLIASLILIALSSTEATITPCSCTFYQNSQYTGSSIVLKAGTYVANLGTSYNFNDEISSFHCTPGSDGSKCWIHACVDANCANSAYGGGSDFIDDIPLVGFMNDAITALTISSYMPNVDPYVYYYKSCTTDAPDYGWFSLGNQNIFTATLQSNHIGNDALSALVVSPAAAVILYKDDNYQNVNLLLTGQTVTCLTQWSGWNDVTSSIRQYDLSKGQAFSSLVGSWGIVGSGTNIAQGITIGYTNQESTTTTNTLETQLSLSLEEGMQFEVASEKTTLTATTTSTVSNSISSSITASYTSSWSVTCDGFTNCANEGWSVTLYAFNLQCQRPWMNVPGYGYTLQIASENTLCICSAYGPPQCPPTFCNDTVPYRCNICKPF